MKTKRYFLGCVCAVLLVLITQISAAARTTLNAYALVIIALACVLVVLMFLLRRRPLLAFGALGLAVGTLLSLGLAQQTPHSSGHRHVPAPAALSFVHSEAMPVDQSTRFEVVLIFPQDSSARALEQFIQTTLKRVHVQSCVHKLPCVGRLLRLSQIGAARSEVIAFDLMRETPQFERAALLSAAQLHPLKPALFHSTSALAAAKLPVFR